MIVFIGQGQGKNWIKAKELTNELQITSLNHKYFRTHLEDCLSLGRPLLVEDIGEELDPALDNLLNKNFIRSGTSVKVRAFYCCRCCLRCRGRTDWNVGRKRVQLMK